jgi:hypothetical protein
MRPIARLATMFSMICALAGCGGRAWAQNVLWEIGKFDQSSLEFNAQANLGDPHYNPAFVVGQSDPARDWPAEQPGSENKALGGRAHPFTIVFNLHGAPQGQYRLTISALLYHPRLPGLLVEINGKSGLFYFQRKLSYYPGEMAVWSPIYGSDQLEIVLPGAALRAGENKLILTALDDPQDGDGDSVLVYDALRLSQEPAARPAPPQVTVETTPLYIEREGHLRELTAVTVTLEQKVSRGEVVLALGKDTFRERLSGTRDFGQQRFEFAIPELAGKTPALLTLNVNGKVHKFPISLEPKRKWTLYIVPHTHLDIGFTDYQAKAAEVQNRNVDKVLDEMEQNPEVRYSIDGSWVVQNYLASRSEATRKRFFKLVHEGKLTVPVQYASLLTGYASLEVLIRSAFYSYQLHRDFGIPFDYANITDVPSYSWSYPSILGALGVKYFAAASNCYRASIIPYGHWDAKSPFWWQGPDGNKILMAYTRQYTQIAFVAGRPLQVPAARQSLPTFLQAFESPDYKPDVLLMFGTDDDNFDYRPGKPAFVKSWNSQYAFPRMVFATFPEYFRYIEQHFGSSLETITGDGGPYWEDGFATDAWYGAIDRANQQRATSAEKLSTLATYLNKNLSSPLKQLRRMWSDLVLYAEHTYTSWGGYSRPESEESVRQLATKDQHATNGRESINAIVDQSLSQLADQIHIPPPALVVFNPLNWTRSELVETDLDAHKVLLEYPNSDVVPVEVLAHYPDYDHVRFLARNVPSLGYKCYQIADSKGRPPAQPGETTLPNAPVLENSFYRIEVDPASGAVSSLYDKESQRELVDKTSPYHLNQYLYVSGGDEGPTQLVYLRKSLPLAKLTVSPAGGGQVARVRKTAYGHVLTARSSGLHAPSIETDIILFDDEKKVQFINRVHKEPVRDREAVYFAFPFAVERPSFSYEIQNGWVDPSRDLLQGAGREWFTVQHWVKVAGSDIVIGLVPLDAPLVTLGDIFRGTWPEKFEPRSATVFSYVINNYWDGNFRRIQDGDFTFRYALTSGRDLTAESLARFGRAAMVPLELGQLAYNDKLGNPPRPLSPAPTAFLEIDSPHVVVENWKAAEDGQGTIVRLLEVGGTSGTVRVTFPLFKLEHVWLSNAVEEKREELGVADHAVEVPLKAHEIVTLRVIASR